MENMFKKNATFSDEAKSILQSTIVSPAHLVNPNFLYIQEAGFFSVNDLFYTQRTNLDSFMIIYTTAGSGNIIYDDKEYTLTPHSCVLFHCMQNHFYRSTPGMIWEHLWIHFNGNNAPSYYEEFTKNNWQPVYFNIDSEVEAAICQIINNHMSLNIAANLVSARLLTKIVTELILQNTYNVKSISIPSFVLKIKEKIKETYKEDITIDELAGYLHLDKFYMMKEFKKHLGTTIFEYIIYLRISNAKELLKYSDLTISEISSQCGIRSVSHFIILFKAREHITPLVYRKQWR
jgi:AraC-like DNA-binding protein